MNNTLRNIVVWALIGFVLFLALVSLVLNLILNYIFIFVYDMGHVGLALATTFAVISVWTIAIIYLFSLRKSLTT